MRLNRRFLALLVLLVPAPALPAQELTERGTYTFRLDRADLSPDGKILAASGGDRRERKLKLWDTAAGKEIASLTGCTNSLDSMAFSADGKRLASADEGLVQVWDVNTHKEIASFQLEIIPCVVALNRDGTRLAAVGRKQVKLWEVDSGKELASFQIHVPVLDWLVGAPFSRDLATLAARNYQEIDLWDTTSGKETATLSEHAGAVHCVVWSADDKTLLASSSGIEKSKGDVILWDVASRNARATLRGPFGVIVAMAPGPDGKTLALLDSPEPDAQFDLKLVDVETGQQRVLPVPQGKLLVAGASLDTLRLWEVSLPKVEVKR
jgi:WD40 repeat protein